MIDSPYKNKLLRPCVSVVCSKTHHLSPDFKWQQANRIKFPACSLCCPIFYLLCAIRHRRGERALRHARGMLFNQWNTRLQSQSDRRDESQVAVMYLDWVSGPQLTPILLMKCISPHKKTKVALAVGWVDTVMFVHSLMFMIGLVVATCLGQSGKERSNNLFFSVLIEMGR